MVMLSAGEMHTKALELKATTPLIDW